MKKILLVLLVMTGLNAQAQKSAVIKTDKSGWHKIGGLTASHQVDKDVIAVLGTDRYKAIKLKVTDAPLNVYDLEVYFENGEKEMLKVRQDLKSGEETRQINLSESHEIKRILFIYKAGDNLEYGNSRVEIYGLK
ncbi:hypothetical protein BH11BAC2_BH11BAC2_18890 [soil metagenome]